MQWLCERAQYILWTLPFYNYNLNTALKDIHFIFHTDFSNKQTTPASATTLDKVPCKFYPNCSKADCPFFHRTKCTTFPLCRFGNNCAYLHPACKFGSACSRVDCVFDHSAVLKTKPPTPAVNTSDVCKFHPKCFNANCVFFHPKVSVYLNLVNLNK